MKINEVGKITGLSKKAIRYYEEQGLLSVGRSENDYRDYDDACVERLCKIRRLRELGIPIADIRLLTDNLITEPELLKRWLSELDAQQNDAGEKIELCRAYLRDGIPQTKENDEFIECEERDDLQPKALGIDIGTTTISISLTDLHGNATRVYAIRNDTEIVTDKKDEHMQGAGKIMEKVSRIVDSFLDIYPSVAYIGLAGQMHGIVYLNADREAVSPLYTWQDGRAGREGGALLAEAERKTGYRPAAGYGLATHLYLQRHGSVPKDAAVLCTIMDYAAVRMCNVPPLLHVSNAASLGFFKEETASFDTEALQTMGMDLSLLPQVTQDSVMVGSYRGVPVCVALGDNQAAFFGSVREEKNSLLVNYGTGSQISMVSDLTRLPTGWERRPYIDGSYIISGSALCGGRAYAALEKFFAAFLDEAGIPHGSLYGVLDRMCEETYPRGTSLRASMLLQGTRADPDLRGSITGLSVDNFTPGDFAVAVQQSMTDELYDLFAALPDTGKRIAVASGNGVRLGKVLRKMLKERYGMPLYIPQFREEAAYGASLFAIHCACASLPLSEIKKHIRYMETDE